MQSPAAIAGLNRRADPQEARIVMQARQGADDPGGDRQVGGEKTMQGVTDRDHLIARIHGASANGGDVLLLEFFWSLQEGKIVGLVSRNHTQFYGSLTCEGAVNVVDAVADDVIIGDDMRVFTDDETGAGNLGQSFRFR